MPRMNLSHFEASVLFALVISVVLGVVTKNGRFIFVMLLPAGRGRPDDSWQAKYPRSGLYTQ